MNNQTGWMVYCITRIDTRKPTVVTVRGPIVVSHDNSALAAALARYGHREFCWEIAGPFSGRAEAREMRKKMIHAWEDPHHNPDPMPVSTEELSDFEASDIYPGTLEMREEFMAAAHARIVINKDYRSAYRSEYQAPALDPTRARKTDEQKAVTKLKQRQRRHHKKLLVRAGVLAKDYEPEE